MLPSDRHAFGGTTWLSTIADLTDYIQRTEKTISDLQREVRRLTKNEGRWENTNVLHPLSTNLSNIREMFLLEIIRDAGLIEKTDIEAVTKKVRSRFVDADTIPWSNPFNTTTPQASAERNLLQVLNEISGDHASDDE